MILKEIIMHISALFKNSANIQYEMIKLHMIDVDKAAHLFKPKKYNKDGDEDLAGGRDEVKEDLNKLGLKAYIERRNLLYANHGKAKA